MMNWLNMGFILMAQVIWVISRYLLTSVAVWYQIYRPINFFDVWLHWVIIQYIIQICITCHTYLHFCRIKCFIQRVRHYALINTTITIISWFYNVFYAGNNYVRSIVSPLVFKHVSLVAVGFTGEIHPGAHLYWFVFQNDFSLISYIKCDKKHEYIAFLMPQSTLTRAWMNGMLIFKHLNIL